MTFFTATNMLAGSIGSAARTAWQEAAEQTLRTIISWGRYGEVFAPDDHRQAFSLENPA